MRKYRTIQGDTWDIIAYRVYPDFGAEKLTSILIEANPNFAEYIKFPAGIILDIPEADLPVPNTLPPWVQV